MPEDFAVDLEMSASAVAARRRLVADARRCIAETPVATGPTDLFSLFDSCGRWVPAFLAAVGDAARDGDDMAAARLTVLVGLLRQYRADSLATRRDPRLRSAWALADQTIVEIEKLAGYWLDMFITDSPEEARTREQSAQQVIYELGTLAEQATNEVRGAIRRRGQVDFANLDRGSRAGETPAQAERRRQQSIRREEAALDRAFKEEARDRQRRHVEGMTADAEAMNSLVERRLAALESILADALAVDPYLDFNALKVSYDPPPFRPGSLATPTPPLPPPAIPPPPPALGHWRKGAVARHEAEVARLEAAHSQAAERRSAAEQSRLKRLEEARADHEKLMEAGRLQVQNQHAQVDRFREQFEGGQSEAVASYFRQVLERSPYPESFPKELRVAYVGESRQLVVERDLPPVTVVPEVAAYKYIKAKDEITSSARSQTEVRTRYTALVARITLRTIYEVFKADRGRFVESVVLNEHVSSVSPSTGQPIHPCLVSVRTTADTFARISLAQVDPIACLRGLNAAVSTKPTELVPVRPILEFAMVDPRFIAEADVLSGLDQRVNLMELTWKEFEGLISNLFERMGLETRQTRASRDGGVDCVAYDPRPIFGGKVVIQAKRYKNTVGVSAVRDLFGTVQNEGASKGILVTTSGYGQGSFEFAQGKPLELLDGGHLLYLLREHAGMEARILPPEGWKDPMPDDDPRE